LNWTGSFGASTSPDIYFILSFVESLKDMGLREISLGSESGDDRTLERIDKKCSAADITEQCAKLTEAGIDFWLCFLNGVAGKEHSPEHAIHSAELFSQCKPMLVGTGGLTLFPGTPLLEEAQRGEFTPLLGKRGMMKLGAMCCHADIINYGSLPYTDFICTKTLCQGGDCCDFLFIRHDNCAL